MKFCKDCCYMAQSKFPWPEACTHPEMTTYDLVTGEKLFTFAAAARKINGKCGLEAKLFLQSSYSSELHNTSEVQNTLEHAPRLLWWEKLWPWAANKR